MRRADPFDDSEFNDSTYLENLVHILKRRVRDERASIRFKIDKAVGRK
ncbi:UNVERIFIED_ORG: hypothetical protein J2Y81_008036 [Paraburkholderia sediminicola]|nr:hypothetical protein [Paraburkholderia sediminicola]